jgi:hypothetical protein
VKISTLDTNKIIHPRNIKKIKNFGPSGFIKIQRGGTFNAALFVAIMRKW